MGVVDLARGRNDAVSLGDKLCLFDADFVGGVFGAGADSFAMAAAAVPPFDEIAALRVTLILAFDAYVIGPDPASAIKEGRGQHPSMGQLDLFEKPDTT